jgi:2-methoxy-6-polyprenyl-1,4-benzoquinol methylase
MRHIDVAGGTGDIAFRVLRAIEAEERIDTKFQNVQDREEGKEKGSVTVFDINPEMLQEGKKKALSRRLGADISSALP